MNYEQENSYSVVPDRPPSLDEKGFRLFVIPADVKGFYRRWRNFIYFVLIFVFLVLPWTRIHGEQTVLLDLAQRRFVFFGHSFFAHDGPLVFFVLAFFVFTILLVTALWGRVWCGWACPQTVFIDTLYRRIETWIEGDYLKRRRLASQPWTLRRSLQWLCKWVLFFVVSSHIAHSFFAYFVGARSLVWVTLQAPVHHWGLFLAVQIFTLVLLADFAWFREQFCLIVCPYGRFQSTLMDKNSLTVTYDFTRGEPRKAKGLKDHGDCINCLRCVNVCPTGIDIRNGSQMECIACTACIDACDEIMGKVKKPKGLIRYTSQAAMEGLPKRTWNLRTFLYSGVLVVLLVGATLSLGLRRALSVQVLRAVETPYQQISPGVFMNHFRFHLISQTNSPIEIERLESLDPSIQMISPQTKQILLPGKETWLHVFFTFPLESTAYGSAPVRWKIHYRDPMQKVHEGEVTLLAPARNQ